MKEIIKIENKDGMIVASSRQVAESFKKDHSYVLNEIGKLKDLQGFGDMFSESTAPDNYGREQRIYFMNRDGFSLISMGFTGKEALKWKLKYIEAFNMMEKAIKKPMSAIDLMKQGILEVDEKVEAVNNDLQAFKQDMPLLAVECDKITAAVNKKGVECLGGKDSNAYNDPSIRGKVYSDIHRQVKREFGVTSYKAIKRSQCDVAIDIIKSYSLPMVLYVEVSEVNAAA